MDCKQARFNTALLLIFLAILFNGCAGRETTQQLVVTEYLLKDAGFLKLAVNDETPERQSLMIIIPRGKIVTYQIDGQVYHVYADEGSNTLYWGDEAAYQKYLSMARGKQLCERVDGSDSSQFWSCFNEYQQAGGAQRRK